VCVVVNAAVGV